MSSVSSEVWMTVPGDMSYVNAFHALWKNAPHVSYFSHPKSDQIRKSKESQVNTAQKVYALFIRTNEMYIDNVGGRVLKTNFKDFPRLNVTGYDKTHGKEAAQKAIKEYNIIPSDQRFDKNDGFHFLDLKKLPSKL